MTISILNYSTFNESYWGSWLTKGLSTPHVSTMLSRFFHKKIISLYTNLLLEISGFQEYVYLLEKNQAKDYIKRFVEIYNMMLTANTIITKQENKELSLVVSKLLEKLSETIEILEDIANPDFAYQLSTNYQDNDWNDPLNDHWDNY